MCVPHADLRPGPRDDPCSVAVYLFPCSANLCSSLVHLIGELLLGSQPVEITQVASPASGVSPAGDLTSSHTCMLALDPASP
jgi:hypothetical protein